MQLEDWLDDLCVRFIINLPPEELASVERICFQVEEAQWFYEDFIRPLDPSLPSLSLKQFSLRIFQHCPLFSQWSAQHHTTAFAEFLAYKQRVPVRGAIMLSEAMDEVLLVKGWKKGANWSFPRGKINKDENDLDCAVREVYEETGFDIREAGLVGAEKDMKYIEVTMREQHMRLYVFRGVPRDTYFEPRTRKEISKIEWYKLTDLPTIKKKAQHDHEEHPAVNANKFYMVAPFLHPLKKWIAQQRKKEIRHGSSGLAVPQLLAEESATETEGAATSVLPFHQSYSTQSLSSLPEVLPQVASHDPSEHLKELLNIGGPSAQPSSQPVVAIGSDNSKSDALLALLRNGSGASTAHLGQTLTNQPQHQIAQASFPSAPPQVRRNDPQDLLRMFSTATAGVHEQPAADQKQPIPVAAPYQQTGDPQFALTSQELNANAFVPPANSLPKLTHHTRALLTAFQTGQSAPTLPSSQLQPAKQSLLDAFRSSAQVSSAATAYPAPIEVSSQPNELPGQPQFSPPPVFANPAASSSSASNLLNLFKSPGKAPDLSLEPTAHVQQIAPAELAAAPVQTPHAAATPSQSEILAALFRKDKSEQSTKPRKPTAKAGQTAATVTGPLNQPSLNASNRSTPAAQHDLRRSPVPANRTLYNPKQPTPVKILARSEHEPTSQPRPHHMSKGSNAAASPKQSAKVKERPQDKPFQPQILKRPQAPDSRQSLTPSPSWY